MVSIRSLSTTSSTFSDFDDDDAPEGPITFWAIKGWILGSLVAVLFIVGYLRIRALVFFTCLLSFLPAARANGHFSYPFDGLDDSREVF